MSIDTYTAPIGAQTVTLAVPLTVNGRMLTELTLRRPRVGDLRRMDAVKGTDLVKTLWMIGTLAELSPAEVDEIDAADLEAVARVVAGFTGTARD